MTQHYDAWNFAVVARFFWKKKIVHAPLVLNFLGLDLRGNWVSRISRQHFPQILQRSPLIPVQFCNYSAVLSRTSRTDFRQTRALCVYKTVLTRRTNLFLYVRNSFSICLPSSFSIYLHHLFFLTFILFSSPFLRHFHPLTLFYFLLLVCLSALFFMFLLPFILPSYVFFLYISFFFPPYLAFNYIPFAPFFHPRFFSCKSTHLPISSQLLAHSSYELHLINV
jgi:hypothetical protein